MNIERKFARQQGFTGNKCPKCGKRTLVKKLEYPTGANLEKLPLVPFVVVSCESCDYKKVKE